LASDPDAPVFAELHIDASTLNPLVSIPPSPTHVKEAEALRDVRIDHAYIGSCASGTLAELHAAARMLEGRRVKDGVHLLVIPATRRIFEAAMKDGTLSTLMAAGAELSGPTCGPCFGGMAQLDAGEVRISTSTRNDAGRMGHRDAHIYLASAMTVAASAITGRITDAREFIEGAR
jgi:3-isopropylmalate/(R)-2-methylmalate dehydratase large subunit